MGDKTGIQWTDATWNPIVGCSVLTPGCKRCYAMKMAARIVTMARGAGKVSHYEGTVEGNGSDAVWTGAIHVAPDKIFEAPLRWRNPRRIFVNSMGDLHHEKISFDLIDRVVRIMAATPQHTYQVLTKRAAGMNAYWDDPELADRIGAKMPLPNVWLGVSAERQKEADERIPHLLRTPAAIRFVSAEPLLEPITFEHIPMLCATWGGSARTSALSYDDEEPRIDWLIVGGESGRGARKFDLTWAHGVVGQCQANGVPCFVKQMGSNPYLDGAPHALGDGHGGDPAEWPFSIRVREFPQIGE